MVEVYYGAGTVFVALPSMPLLTELVPYATGFTITMALLTNGAPSKTAPHCHENSEAGDTRK